MLSNDTLIQAAIIAALVIIFIISVILNKKTAAPKDSVLPDKCQFCPSSTCVIRVSDIDKIKVEARELLDNCEENNNESKKN